MGQVGKEEKSFAKLCKMHWIHECIMYIPSAMSVIIKGLVLIISFPFSFFLFLSIQEIVKGSLEYSILINKASFMKKKYINFFLLITKSSEAKVINVGKWEVVTVIIVHLYRFSILFIFKFSFKFEYRSVCTEWNNWNQNN